MHIELTDHLRCPQDHPESFLVLLPDSMTDRRVVSGHLGCPVCGWSCAWTDEIPDFGAGWRGTASIPFDAAAAIAMLGVTGPGGWIALADAAGMLAEGIAEQLPGVRVVTVNPPPSVHPDYRVSVVLSGRWPIKSHSMRGVVLGSGWPDVESAMRSALPGLRIVGAGPVPANVALLAEAEGVWVAASGEGRQR